jgi:hypothetical protein
MGTRWRSSRGGSVGREQLVALDSPTRAVRQTTTRTRYCRTDGALVSAYVLANDSKDLRVHRDVLVRPGLVRRGVMRHRALYSVVAVAWCVAMAIPRAEAQLASLAEFQPGTRVRVQAPGVVAGPLEATVVARSRDTVTLTRQHGGPISVPLGAITAAEVSRGRSHGDGAVKGLSWGAGAGLVVGLLSAIVYDARSDACGLEPCENDLSPGEVVAGGFLTGAVLGAGIGAIAGSERWERLTIPTFVALRPNRVGLTLLGVPF